MKNPSGETPSSDKNESKWYVPEFALPILFIIVGFIGYYNIMDNMTYRSYEDSNEMYQVDKVRDNRASVNKKFTKLNPFAHHSNSPDASQGNHLIIDGFMEASSPVIFKIPNFSRVADYVINFGDGTKRKLHQGAESHIYQNPGQYSVSLIAKYEGKEMLLAKKSIHIMESIAVSTGATSIDF